jgi:hypothetical protein
VTISPASPPVSPRTADYFGSDPERLKDLVARAGELLRRAILTDAVLPDRDRPRGYLPTLPSMSPADRIAAFGFETALAVDEETREIQRRRASRFKPSRDDIERFIEVLSWLSWLKRQGEEGAEGVRIIRLRAFRISTWSIGQRLGISDDTVRRRHLSAVTRIAAHHWQRVEAFA